MIKSSSMKPAVKRYEQFPHTADIGIRAFGRDIKKTGTGYSVELILDA